MSRHEAIKFVFVRSIGNFLLLMSLYGVVMTFGPVVYHEVQFRVAQARGVTFAVQAPSIKNVIPGDSGISKRSNENVPVVTETVRDSGHGQNDDTFQAGPNFAAILAGAKEQVIVPKDTQFSIVIPKLGASAKVFPNVDPNNDAEFKPVLQQGVAHAKGTVFPGMTGNSYLFAHSADNFWDVGRYNAIFYLLKNLQKDDEIIIFFEQERYDYVVTETFIAEASDVSLLLGQNNNGREQLILQTCWPPGTTLKRQFVIAVPKSSQR